MKSVHFDTLEMGDCVQKLLKHWAGAFKSRNILWLSRAALVRLAPAELQIWKWSPDVEKEVQSLRPLDLKQAFEKWKYIGQLPLQRSLAQPQTVIYARKTQLMVPVSAPQTSRVIGYFLFEDVGCKITQLQLKKAKSMASSCATHLEFCWQFAQSRSQSFIDDLTTLYNQRYLPVVFEREIARTDREKKKFSVLFLDIDFFKRVNDTRGHWTGSRLLVEVSAVIQRCIRTCDYAFRYGGDEFLVVLVDAAGDAAQTVAERIRAAIEHYEFSVDGASLRLTVSIGLATYPDHAKSTVELIQLADRAMYHGKRKSRNIVFLAG